MIIDSTYFFGEISIPNINQEPIEAYVDELIGSKEPVYLHEVLGYRLSKELLEAAESSSQDEKWVDLLKGKEYEFNGVLTKWQGLAPDSKVSPIAYYIFDQYIRLNESNTSGIGEVASNAENSTRIQPIAKTCVTWNTMVRMNWELYKFLTTYKDVYGFDYRCCNQSFFNTINWASI